MLWTHFGVSGPVVLDISRYWHRVRLEQRNVTLQVNFLPGEDFALAERRLIDLAAARSTTTVRTVLGEWMPARVGEALCAALGLEVGVQMGQLPREGRRRLVHGLVDWPLPVRGGRGYNYAEATAGGVPLTEVDAGLASRKCPGVYLAGEVLDVDGRIGGFNFQWAWSSGWAVSQTLALCSG